MAQWPKTAQRLVEETYKQNCKYCCGQEQEKVPARSEPVRPYHRDGIQRHKDVHAKVNKADVRMKHGQSYVGPAGAHIAQQRKGCKQPAHQGSEG